MKTNLKQLFIIAAIVLFLWLASGLMIWKCVPSQERGMFGDMFGAVNALFSGLALAGIVYTILLQRDEIRLSGIAQEKVDKSFKKQLELMHLSNIMAAKVSLINAYTEIILPSNANIVTNAERDSFVSKLKTQIYEMEAMQIELREREQA